jgi:hypothetical protein
MSNIYIIYQGYMCRILKSKLKANWADLYQSRPGYIYFGPAYQLLGRYWFTQAGLFSRGRPWAGMRAMPAGPGYPGQATRRLGRSPSNLGWAGRPPQSRLGRQVLPRRLTSPGPRMGLRVMAAAWPEKGASARPHPGWVSRLAQAASQLGRRFRPGQAFLSPSRLGRIAYPRPGFLQQAGVAPQAGIGPGRVSYAGQIHLSQLGRHLNTVPAEPGRDSLAHAGLFPPRPSYPPVGRDSPYPGHILHPASGPRFTLCQSWDASRLGLAHPTSSYVGLGTPLGSDQHIPPLLVSLILRRRIRLMTWRS